MDAIRSTKVVVVEEGYPDLEKHPAALNLNLDSALVSPVVQEL